MALNAARAALVLREYRYAIAQDATVKARFPEAREVVIETNLDENGGATLANSVMSLTKTLPKVYDIPIVGILFLEDFTNGPARYTVTLQHHPAASEKAVYTLIGARIDYGQNRTVLKVLGV